MKKYRIGEVAKILNISVDTLRFYEKSGIISPQKDKNSTYRVYDDWDINYILEYQHFRKMDFTAKEIKKVLYEMNFSEYLDLLNEKQRIIQEKALYYRLLEQKNAEQITNLLTIDFDFHLVEMPSKVYVSHRKNFEYVPADSLNGIYDAWMKYYALLDNTVIIRQNDLLRDSDDFEWGFSINKKDAECLELPYSKEVEEFPNQLYLKFIVNAGERWNFSKDLIKPALEYAHGNGYELSGDIFGRLLARINDEDYLRYIEFYLPIIKTM